MAKTRSAADWWAILLIALLILVAGFPLLWMALSSLRPPQDLLATPPRLVTALSLHWYRAVFAGTDAWRWFANSAVVAAGTAVLNMVVGSMAAFGITRFRFPGRRAVTLGALLAYVVPPILVFLPLYVILDALRLTNSHVGGIVAHTVLTLPFCLWLLLSFFNGVPRELDEAALIDGATTWQIYRLVVLPLALQGVLATGILAFIISWSEYLLSSTLMSRGDLKTVPVALGEMASSAHAPWGEIMVLGTLTAVPVLILFAVVQRWFVQGVTAGAVKG